MRWQTKLPTGGMIFLWAVFGMVTMKAQSNHANTIFKIGVFDRSSAEFSQEIPTQPINFIVGKSNPAKDWYARQLVKPVSPEGQRGADASSAPRTITFSLDHAPAAAYQLHIAVLVENPSVPELRIGINGKHGKFFLHPRFDSNAGDEVGFFGSSYSHADVIFDFPGNYLRRGINTMTLQVVEEAGKTVRHARITYDAVELDQGATDFRSQTSAVQLSPSIFYQRRQGELDEIVDLFIRYYGQPKPGSQVNAVIAGRRYQQMLQGGQDFGEENLEFDVPEFSGPTRAKLTWRVNGKFRHETLTIVPQKKWTLFLVPHIHLDIGFSDYQAKVASIQSRVIDEAMEMTAQHPEFRFSMDGEWSLEQFMKTRTLAQQQQVITNIQKQRLFIPAQYGILLTGFPTAETLLRSLYASANFSREYGTPFNYANLTDVPSYSWSYASILASAGIHYLLSGSDNYRAPVLLRGRLNENSPFWWQGPDGQKVLFWYARTYAQTDYLFGWSPHLSVSAGREMLPLFLQQYEKLGYRANATIIFGTQDENTDMLPPQAELAQRWNSVYAYPQLQYSGFHKALKNIAQQFGKDIPIVSGDGGPYWEDGIASDAYYAAMERRNESRGASAEKLATLTSLVDPRLTADKTDIDRMWKDMVLMDEHTWGSYNSVSNPTSREAVQQLAVKDLYAVKAQALADFVARDSMTSLADLISVGRDSLIVFNTLNWDRSGLVTIDLKAGDEIVDATTRQVVPMEVLAVGDDSQRVRFVAQNIPAVGYKVFQLRPAKKPAAPAVTTQTTSLESPYYRVQLDAATGAVRSIYDKQLQRELVNQQSPYRFGQYLYVTGGDDKDGKTPNTILQYSRIYPKAVLQVHPAGGGHLIAVTRTPYGWVARMESADTNTPKITSEIRVFDQEKKIEFVENVNKKEVDTKEAVYFAFPFNMDKPQFQYEIQTGVVDPEKNMYPGAGQEWFSVQHWVSVQQNGVSATVMPLDASLVTLGDINRGAWPAQFGERTGTIFSYAMNNYWGANYRAGQGGHFRFRYVMTSAPSTRAAELSRMGWEEMTPLEKDEVTQQDKPLDLPRPLNGRQGGFLNVNDAKLLLDAWKPAEDGKGTILRFLDIGGATRTVTIQTPLLHLQQAWQADAVERNQEPLSLVGTGGVAFTVHPHEIVTVRIIGEDVTQSPSQK